MTKQIKGNNLFSVFELVIIAVFWFLLFASPFLLGNNEYNVDWDQIFKIWIGFIPYLIMFLINRFVLLPYLFFRNKRWLFMSSAALLILIMSFGVYHFQDKSLPPPNRMNRFEQSHRPPNDLTNPPLAKGQNPRHLPPPNRMPPYLVFGLISVLIIGFDTGLRLSVLWVRSEQKRVNAEKENMEMQLAFLRNQVSPHFFMNTLNNIHALIDYDTEEAKESIIRLSKLMRHLLYDSEAEKIPVQKEIDFICNYVDLMKLRYSDKVIINLKLPDQIPNKSIPPLLFTSYVENAFKHGISYQHESFIDIKFSYASDKIFFEARNSYFPAKNENEHAGIGVENSRKRLDLIYGDQYLLEIQELNNEFVVKLSIPL